MDFNENDDFKTIYASGSKNGKSQKEPDYGFNDSGFSMKSPDEFGKNITKYGQNLDMSGKTTEKDKERKDTDVIEADPEMITGDIVDAEQVLEEHEEIHSESYNESVSGEVEGHGIYYKTKDVARELGITVQDVRNYDKMFEEYLNVERTPSGHRLFTREYIDKMAAILELKRANNYTFEQTREALSTDEGQIMSTRDEMERLHKLLELMTSRIELSGREVKQAVKEAVDRALTEHTEKLLLDSNEKNEAQMEELRQQNEALKTALAANQTASAQSVTELKEQLRESRKENEKIMEMLTSVLADQHSKDTKMAEITEQNEKLLAEITKKRKRWFFKD